MVRRLIQGSIFTELRIPYDPNYLNSRNDQYNSSLLLCSQLSCLNLRDLLETAFQKVHVNYTLSLFYMCPKLDHNQLWATTVLYISFSFH